MKFYIAGSSANMEPSEYLMAELRERGHTITYDWCAEIRKEGGANPVTATDDDRMRWAFACLESIEEADIFVAIMDKHSKGALYELARAYEHENAIIIGSSGTIFDSIYERFADTASFLAWVDSVVQAYEEPTCS